MIPNHLIDLIDPSSITVLGVVLGLSFGVSIGITSLMAWLRPPRGAVRRPVNGVKRQAVSNGPQQTWQMASLRPALRHVWRRQSESIIVAAPIPAGTALERLARRIEPGLARASSVGALQSRAMARIESTDYAIAELRRDMARLMPAPAAQRLHAAFSLPVLPRIEGAAVHSAWAA